MLSVIRLSVWQLIKPWCCDSLSPNWKGETTKQTHMPKSVKFPQCEITKMERLSFLI